MEEARPVQPGRPRELAPLDDGIDPDRRAFAEHLRLLRERSGLSSKDLATALEINHTRLSKFLNGTELPPAGMKLTTRLHRLLDELGVAAYDEEEARASRDLLYTAVRAKGPLPFRPYALEEAEETNARQQAEAARELAALQEDLDRERARRKDAEDQLERLDRLRGEHGSQRDSEYDSEHGSQRDSEYDSERDGEHGSQRDSERAELIRRLEDERDAALRRVAELEDQAAQTAALLRLLQDEARHLREMATATQRELDHWESGTAPAVVHQPTRTPPAMSAEQIISRLEILRDDDRDHEADGMLTDILMTYPPTNVAALGLALDERGRRPDLSRLLVLAAHTCDGPQLRRLLVAKVVQESEPADGHFFRLGPTSTTLLPLLMPVVAKSAPVPVLVRLAKAFRQRSEDGLLEELSNAAALRPSADHEALREGGIPALLWWSEKLSWGRVRIHTTECPELPEHVPHSSSAYGRADALHEADKPGRSWCPKCGAHAKTAADYWAEATHS